MWTGERMLAWGGYAPTGDPNTGFALDPAVPDEDGDGVCDPLDACLGDPVNDPDGDSVCDSVDNCPAEFNPTQSDLDADGIGDPCDVCPLDALNDGDGDGLCADVDNCPLDPNPGQQDDDGDQAGQACDCFDSYPFTHPGAPEINAGRDNQCPGDPGYGLIDEITGIAGFHAPNDKDRFSWPPQSRADGYQVARADSGDFQGGCATLPPTVAAFIVDTEPVPIGVTRRYLVRAAQSYPGSWGADSSGEERDVPCD